MVVCGAVEDMDRVGSDGLRVLEWAQAAGLRGVEIGTTAVPRTLRTGAEMTFGLGMVTDTAITASRPVLGGVTAVLPGLRICLAHGGVTFAWMLPRIARAWDAGHDRPPARRARVGRPRPRLVRTAQRLLRRRIR